MAFFYSVRTLFSNFSLMWKQFLYIIIVSFLGLGLLAIVGKPILESLIEQGFIEQIYNILKNFSISFNLNTCLNSCVEIIHEFIQLVTFSFANFRVNTIWFLIVLFFIIPYVIGLSNYTLSECLYRHLSSNTKKSFVSTFVETFLKNVFYQFFKTIVNLLYFALMAYVLYLTYNILPTNGIFYWLSPIIILLEITILLTIKNIFLCCWLPAIISHKKNVFVGFGINLKVVFKNFGRVCSNTLMVVFVLIVFNFIFTSFAFFITIPLTMLFINSYNMVLYFTNMGMNFYVDYDNIIRPKKLEENIKMSELKYLL